MSIRPAAFLLLLMLVACRQAPAAHLSPAAPSAIASSPAFIPIPPTLTPTVTPVPTATLTIQQAIYPYTIDGLRAHDYHSGDVRILATLAETDDYTRYRIEYPSDGLTISGVMQVPTVGEAPYPVIVMNHGFFSRTVYGSGDGTDRAAEFLNKCGYLTLASDYRSWGKSDFGPSLFYSGLAIDVVNLLNAIPSIEQADPARIGMWGHSMGGGVTMKVLTIEGNNAALSGAASSAGSAVEGRIKAAVLYSTVSADQADVLERWGLGCYGDVLSGETRFGCNSSDIVPLDLPAEVLDAFYKAFTDPEILRRISPIFNLDYVTAPVQIHYGTRDGEVLSGTPPEWSTKLFQAFLDAGKPVKLFAYEGERHSFIGDPWYKFMEENVRFFDKYVKNAP
jgi:dipeptidyl aminopeptidase/acylaminoacyl peptidase